jgi:hypothetical protein
VRDKGIMRCLLVTTAALLLYAEFPRLNAVAECYQEQEGYNPPPFASYPQTPAFRSAIYFHLHPAETKHDDASLILYATWFLRGNQGIAQRLLIYGDGYAYSVRSVFNHAEQAGHWTQLPSHSRKRIAELIETMEQTDASPSLDDLLILSFDRRGEWMTAMLDRNSLPEGISEIYALTRATSPVRQGSAANAAAELSHAPEPAQRSLDDPVMAVAPAR